MLDFNHSSKPTRLRDESPFGSFIRERGVTFQIGDAFYRKSSRLSRDLSVLAGAIERSRLGSLRVLDAMAGSGVRALRYWQEAGATDLLVNEGNPDVLPLLRANLAAPIATGAATLASNDANRAFFQCYIDDNYYDIVDVDGFGAPVPWLSTSLWAARLGGLVYLASTDGRTATGHLPEQSLRMYGARARSHPAAHEQGLRLMIGSLQQQAAVKGFGIAPVFSLFRGEVYRVMVRLTKGQKLRDHNYAYLAYCHDCGNYQVLPWHKIGQANCPHDGLPLTLSGPQWVGELHDRAYLGQMHAEAIQRDWSDVADWLTGAIEEAEMPPYFFKLGEIGKRGQMDIPKRDRLIAALRDRGFRASVSHVNREAFKTTADLQTCIAIAKTFGDSVS